MVTHTKLVSPWEHRVSECVFLRERHKTCATGYERPCTELFDFEAHFLVSVVSEKGSTEVIIAKVIIVSESLQRRSGESCTMLPVWTSKQGQWERR